MKRTRRQQISGRAGFTLLEVLLVLAILVVLASLVTYFLVGAQSRGYAQAAKTQILALEGAVNAYRIQTGQYPQQLQDLVVMPQGMTREKWGGPHLQAGKGVPKDPWGRDYQYTLNNGGKIAPGQTTPPFTIKSQGEDIGDPTDDISNEVSPTSS